MGLSLGTRRAAMGAPSYVDKVLSYAPIAYWPLTETGGTTAKCLVNAAQNGTSVGVDWNNAIGPDGVNGAPYFDGANDYINIFTAALDAAFNGATGSAMMWAKVNAAAVWTDGALRNCMNINDDANNYYQLRKSNANNQYQGIANAGGGTANLPYNPFSLTTWFHLALTWSDGANADQAIMYINGAVVAGPSAALNVWAGGGLTANAVTIGAVSTVPNQVWHGWLAHCAVWDTVLTPAQIAILANSTP